MREVNHWARPRLCPPPACLSLRMSTHSTASCLCRPGSNSHFKRLLCRRGVPRPPSPPKRVPPSRAPPPPAIPPREICGPPRPYYSSSARFGRGSPPDRARGRGRGPCVKRQTPSPRQRCQRAMLYPRHPGNPRASSSSTRGHDRVSPAPQRRRSGDGLRT